MNPIPMPPRIARLPLDPVRKVPVPWFVHWEDGRPEFRIADDEKRDRAVKERLCWVCGERLDNRLAFVIGPMCGINRTSAEPPCHPDCARYSALACPFLARPAMDRRESGPGRHAGKTTSDGEMIRRNPGCCAVWTTRGYAIVPDGRGGTLFRVGEPTSVEWFAEGRPATLAEVEESIRTGLPLLEEMCLGNPHALALLREYQGRLIPLLPPA